MSNAHTRCSKNFTLQCLISNADSLALNVDMYMRARIYTTKQHLGMIATVIPKCIGIFDKYICTTVDNLHNTA